MKVKKVESTIRPGNFRIGDIKDNLTEVVFFDDIEEVKRTTTDGTEETIYTYYEYAIKIISRDDLEDYINDNLDTWKELAKQNFIASKAAEIRAIRDKLLSESDKHVLIDRLGITIPEHYGHIFIQCYQRIIFFFRRCLKRSMGHLSSRIKRHHKTKELSF